MRAELTNQNNSTVGNCNSKLQKTGGKEIAVPDNKSQEIIHQVFQTVTNIIHQLANSTTKSQPNMAASQSFILQLS